jgi:hypothetical protein
MKAAKAMLYDAFLKANKSETAWCLLHYKQQSQPNVTSNSTCTS